MKWKLSKELMLFKFCSQDDFAEERFDQNKLYSAEQFKTVE